MTRPYKLLWRRPLALIRNKLRSAGRYSPPTRSELFHLHNDVVEKAKLAATPGAKPHRVTAYQLAEEAFTALVNQVFKDEIMASVKRK
jgi:hypothetical protein